MIVGAAVLLTACDVKDPIYETDHPGKAEVTVKVDWSGIDPNIKPADYWVSYQGDELKAEADEFTMHDLDPGSYTLYSYNKPEGIAISETLATATYIATPLGWLFTGKLTETVEADKDYTFTVPMKQQVRQLTLVIEPTGGTADKIESITATLSGVAGTLDMDSDTHGTPSNAPLTFTKGSDGKWSATVRLLGVTGSVQKMTGTITFTGGTPADIPLESDLSSGLADFNTEKNEPLALNGGRVELPTEAGFTATINDWTKNTGTGIAD